MSKMRVHELAKQIEIDSKEIIKMLNDKGIEVKNHMSSISDEDAQMVKNAFSKANAHTDKPVKTEKPASVEKPAKTEKPASVEKPAKAEKSASVEKPVNKEKASSTEKSNTAHKTETAAKAESSKKEDKAITEDKNEEKKSHISQVFRPQNSNGNTTNRTNSNANRNSSNGANRTNNANSNNENNNNRQTGQNNNNNRPVGQNNNNNRQTGQNNNNNRPVGQNNNNNRPVGQNNNNNRQTGQNNNNNRPVGQNNNNNRPTGQNNNNNRPTGQNNNNNRPTGQNNNNNRPTGQNNNNNRPAGQNSNNNRPTGQNNNNNRQAGQNSNNNRQGGQYNNNNSNNNRQTGNNNRPNQGGNRPNQGFRPNQGGRRPQQPAPKPVEEKVELIIIPESLTIKELADKMKMQPSAVVKKLFLEGKMVTINQEVEFDEAEEIAMSFDIMCELEEKVDVIEELLKEDDEDETKLVKRPPVICVMGHVDHGKTSLLDAIRETNVIAKEAGGITQHIGAYTVECKGEKITFLDTPGHEAFTAMRMRGAQSTDIAILVVAADDGVMPQTVEAINHAKAAGISIIVAVNKMDKPSANIERVKQELAEYELVAEDWGGDTIFVPVSAHTKEGIDTLLEMIILTAEVSELKANPNRKARGLVIEAQLDKGRGTVATILVQKGTLKVGDSLAAGSCFGKVRAMIDDKGRRVKEAGPSTPVEILGLNNVPNAGEIFVATDTEKEARAFADTFISEGREKLLEGSKAKSKMSLDDLFSQIQAGDVKELDIIIKADVQGSVEAVKQSLVKLSNEEVVVKVIHGGVGAINESDVILASASNAIVIGFNVRPDNTAKETAEREGVDVRLYRVIYNAIEDVEAAMKGMLDPVYEEKVIGHAEIRQTFKASGIGTIAGSYILDGSIQRGCSVRITREGNLIFEGPLASVKRMKDDVKEVKAGFECGLVFEKFNEIEEFDQIEAYIMQEVPR